MEQLTTILTDADDQAHLLHPALRTEQMTDTVAEEVNHLKRRTETTHKRQECSPSRLEERASMLIALLAILFGMLLYAIHHLPTK